MLNAIVDILQKIITKAKAGVIHPDTLRRVNVDAPGSILMTDTSYEKTGHNLKFNLL